MKTLSLLWKSNDNSSNNSAPANTAKAPSPTSETTNYTKKEKNASAEPADTPNYWRKNNMTQPTHKTRLGTVEVAVWENKHTKDGKEFTTKNLALQRSYKDDKGEWQNQKMSLKTDEVLKLILCLQEAYKKVHE